MPDGSNTMHSETTFIPGPDNQRALRDALGCFATGVTVVTCRDAQGPLAMTANSFAGVSLDPAIVLWSPALTSARHDSFVAAEHFVIHIMSTAQKDLCTHFALNGRGFDDVAWSENAQGVPVLPDCVAHRPWAQALLTRRGPFVDTVRLVVIPTEGPNQSQFCLVSWG